MIEKLDFQKALERIKPALEDTNLIKSNIFSQESGNNVFIKPENLQNTGSFKIRGAYNKIKKLPLEVVEKGLIASSAGNHAQGVAYAANKIGIKSTIVMPKTTPLVKVESTKAYGSKVVLHGDCYDEAFAEAKRLQEKNNYTFIHPFNDLDVIEGQGTISNEILEEMPDTEIIVAPVGGGGLISGVALAAKKINPNIKIIGVEPRGAKTLINSLESGKVRCLETVKTIADGVAVKEPGDLTFKIVEEYVDEIVEVTDYDVMEAFIMLLDKHKLLGENAGVLSLAGLKKIKEKYRDKKIVAIVSGGNIDVLTISSMIGKGLVNRGRIFSFTVELQDIPGELEKISKILSETNGNVIKLEHNQFKSIDRFMEVELEITVETNGVSHIKKITDKLRESGYEVKVL